MTILLSDKQYYQTERNIDKRANPPRRHSDVPNVYVPKIRAANYVSRSGRTEGGDREIHNYSWKLQHPLLTAKTTIRQEIIKDIEELDNTIN